MSLILNIETSTSVCSAALTEGDKVVFEKVSFEGHAHAALLGVYVEEALGFVKENGLKLDAVAVSSGPGSYTGLRIGVSMAKGLCFGYGIPLIGIHSLDIMAYTAIRANNHEEGLYCSMMDARRMEVYSAFYDADGNQVRETSADIINADSYLTYLEKGKVFFFGDGSSKCKSVLTSPNAVFIDAINPLASNMGALSQKAFDEKHFEDVAYFEPFYLKEFQATIAKNKVLSEALAKVK